MDGKPTVWVEEQRRVTEVIANIGRRIEELKEEVQDVWADVRDIRQRFWEEVTVNLTDADDRIETAASMRQQAETLSERERRYRKASDAMKKLIRLQQNPYFGRVDFVEEGEREAERIYLGIASFQDGEFGPFLIYDWRAPISSLYYDHDIGEASYHTPMGEIKGDLQLKRQFAIRDGEIRLLFDTGVTIGDELLQRVLSRNSDVQMKSIVATIQKAQNAIIRDDKHRMVIVQGAAGSGKTSAALQRVAYLLYKHRETLRADQIVLFSPNPLFNSYVSSVLPELGEENMQQTTFQEYMDYRLGSRFTLEDPFDQMELLLQVDAADPAVAVREEGIRYKSSSEFFKAVVAYRDRLLQDGMRFRPIFFRDRAVIDSDAIRRKFYSYNPSIRLLNRIELVREWLLEELAEFERGEVNQSWVDEEMQFLSAEDYQLGFKEFRRNRGSGGDTFDDFAAERDILARMVVRKNMAPVWQAVEKLEFVDVTALYAQLFSEEGLLNELTGHVPEHWNDICRYTLERLERNELPNEDATPYLFLQELVQGFQINHSIRHVIIDEVQDYSPFQLEFLKRLFPRARMTVLGDLNQAIFPHASAFDDHEPLFSLYGPEESRLYRLTKSYRSTREIVEFTRRMIPGGEAIEPFDRRGDVPEVKVVESREALHDEVAHSVNMLKEAGYESIGIICKTAAESDKAYRALEERGPVKLVTKDTVSFEKGVLIIPVYLAKGVEFDAVIIYDGSRERYGRESDRKLFYTACTRAMHELHIYSIGEASPFLPH